MRRAVFSVFLLLLAGAFGCDDPTKPAGSDPSLSLVNSTGPHFDVNEAARNARSTGVFFAKIHEVVPGFAGMTFEDGIPTVYMTGKGRGQVAESVLAPFFVARGKAGRGVRIRPAEYDWGDLYDWRLKARALFDLNELESLKIDTDRNRIVIGLKPGSSSARATERLAGLGIDLDAVEFQEAQEAPPLSSLTDRIRPVMGGIQIKDAGGYICTFGANVEWDNEPAYLTAAHCSGQRYQPTYGTGNHISDGDIDTPSTFSCTPEDQSPSNYCRWGDFALMELDDTVSVSFGHIARPFYSGKWGGSTNIKGRFWITDSYYTAIQGDTVHKVGAVTGWTAGPIIDPDVDRRGAGTPYWNIEQVEVEAGALGGDSGSPVFEMGTYGRVSLAGILWGGGLETPDSTFFYTPLWNIQEEFGGYIDVITDSPSLPSGVSISGPTTIQPDATCLWEGSVSGGTTPFSYTWENNTHIVSYTDSYTGGKLSGSSGSSFVLKFTVTNDAGSTYDQITVTLDSNAPECVY